MSGHDKPLGLKIERQFLEPLAVIKAMFDDATPFFTEIPDGLKENIYFVISNVGNISRGRNLYPDDCGTWQSSSGSTQTCYYNFQETGIVQVDNHFLIICIYFTLSSCSKF